MEEDEEIIGQAGEDEDELDEDHEYDHDLVNSAQETKQTVKQEEPEVPLFRYRNSVTSASYVVKVGNERRGSTSFKPKSAAAPKHSPFFPPAPKRSKSEQPASKSEKSKSVTPVPQTSRATTPITPGPSRFKTPAPRSREVTPATPRVALVCPICARELETDNNGLNAHIDYCLSKGAIMEATSASSSPKNIMKRKRDGQGY